MIDWSFIYAREGGRRLRGYVPPGVNSGVTIADGVDLGQIRSGDILALPHDLQNKVLPFIGLIGAKARLRLELRPLEITDAEADALEQPKRKTLIGALAQHYDRDSGVAFTSLPDAAQTVLASVTWQYGTPWVRTPHFWHACCDRNWPEVLDDLRHFGDAYTERRCLEAEYLEKGLTPKAAE